MSLPDKITLTQQKHPGLNLGDTDIEANTQAEETIFGFWVFLMSDMVLFALLFATYAVMLNATAGGPEPAEIFELWSAAVQTALLLASSFAFGMAQLAMKYEIHRHRLAVWLGVTLLLGLAFLGFEFREFYVLISEGAGPSRSGFLSAFFALVSLHGLHVIFGCIWIVVAIVQALVFKVDRSTKLNILRLGLFWHLLDVVWIFIFSVVYLQGLA